MKVKTILITLASMVLLFVVLFGLQYIGVVNYKFFAPKYQDAQREVFENTQSYNEGKRQDLVKYYQEWLKSDKEGKSGLKEIVLEDFSNNDITKLTPNEKDMYDKITEYKK